MQQANTEARVSKAANHRRRFAPLGVVFGLLGLSLFAYFVRKAGLDEILTNIRRLGAGFLIIIAISSIRHLVRAFAWTRCVEAPYKLRFRDAFAARLMGDALGRNPHCADASFLHCKIKVQDNCSIAA